MGVLQREVGTASKLEGRPGALSGGWTAHCRLRATSDSGTGQCLVGENTAGVPRYTCSRRAGATDHRASDHHHPVLPAQEFPDG